MTLTAKQQPREEGAHSIVCIGETLEERERDSRSKSSSDSSASP